MKKLCSFLLAIVMVFGMLPAGVLAADNYVAGMYNGNPFGEFSLKAQIGEYIYTVDSMGNLSRLNLQTEKRDSFVKQIGGIDEFITNGKFIYYQGYEPDGVYQVDISTRESKRILDNRVDKLETSSTDAELHYIFNGEHCVKVLNNIVSSNNSGDLKEITVTLNGKKIDFDQLPIIVEGRTIVPLRAIFEALGATVDWNGTTQTVTSTKDGTTISMTIGQTEMYKNGEVKKMDVAPQIVNGRTLVPVRAIAESFNIDVDWDGDTNTVILNEY